MKPYLILTLLVGGMLLVAGCQRADTDPPVEPENGEMIILQARLDSVEVRNTQLEEDDRLKHDFLEEYITLINQTLNGLDAMAEREGMLRQIRLDLEATEAGTGPSPGTIQKRVHDNLSAIERYIEDSKQERDELTRQRDRLRRLARQRAVNVSNLETTIGQLNSLIEEKEHTIVQLRQEAERLLVRIADLSQENVVLAEENTELREAFYVVGTRIELQGQGIIDRSGGFLSIGRKTTLDEFDAQHFLSTNVDKDRVFLGQDLKRYQVLSDHKNHESLFQFEEQDAKVFLSIGDTEEFWKVSRYLVVEVKR